VPTFLFRCPNNGYRVQGFVAEEDFSDDAEDYQAVTCLAIPETSQVVVGSTGTANVALGTAIWSGKELPRQPPKEHPIYALIGQVAAAWAQVDHLLDILIWQLADVDPQAGACITAEITGTLPGPGRHCAAGARGSRLYAGTRCHRCLRDGNHPTPETPRRSAAQGTALEGRTHDCADRCCTRYESPCP
jgi:hypothetical protein